MKEGLSHPEKMRRPHSAWVRWGKRLFDGIAACLGLLLLSPLFAVCALLIRLEGRGSIFFTQERSGQGRRPFRIVKFRTMRSGRRPDPAELVPLDHPEITRVGRFLRRFKLDEMPQLFNVLRGDMALVGPRPTLPDQTERYDAFQRERLRVRPGLTGLAQIYCDTALGWEHRIAFDVAYVRACSPWLDFWILLRTPLVVIRGDRREPRSIMATPFMRWLIKKELERLSEDHA